MSVQQQFEVTGSGPREHNGTMELWDGGDVPGIAGERAGFERSKVVGEMGDDHFQEFVRKID